MPDKAANLITSRGIIAICRGIYGDELLSLAAALKKGGIRLLEVTFDQSDALCLQKTHNAVKSLCESFDDMCFGAGTVLTFDQVSAAKNAGAAFIISPNTDIEVIKCTKKSGMISIPGAMTPSEIMSAHNAGADFVKLFPAGQLGLKYLKDLRAPLSHIKLIATGGINADNFADFLSCGCIGAGISGALCDKTLIKERDWQAITDTAAQLICVYDKHRKKQA